jgi:DNA processing protein
MNSDRKQRLIEALTLLSVPNVGRGRFNLLVRRFGSIAMVFAASVEQLELVNGISVETAHAIKEGGDVKLALKTAHEIERLQWTVLFTDDPEYPPPLNRIEDSPPILFRLGRPTLPHERLVAIVGTRRCSDESRRFTRQLAHDLTNAGLVVVSGMAEGIDGAAHRGALDAGGSTVAVWGTSLDKVFPVGHKQLAQEIEDAGTIYSEILPGVPTEKGFFPARNRLISGLSEAVIVVEAGEKSGALITAHKAVEQGRELFAVPGFPTHKRFAGTNRLIKEGANLLTEAADIFEAIPRLKDNARRAILQEMSQLSEIERGLVDCLADGPVQIDHLSRVTETPVSDLMGFLLALELKGVVQEVSGKRFCLSDNLGVVD